MNAHTQTFFIASAVGQLECALDLPDAAAFAAPRGIALVGHPHPLYGGAMTNKVVHTLTRAFVTLGYATARMNFRGVGQSEGVYDEGRGETDDMALLLEHMRQHYPEQPLALAGFSFGTLVQAQLQQRLTAAQDPTQTPAERLVLVGCAAGKWPIPEVPDNTLLIHGEADTTIPLADVLNWARPQDLAVTVVPGADHFFNHKLHHIKNQVLERWHR